MAPLLLLPIGFYLNKYFLPTINPSFVNYILYVLLQTVIIENSLPSSADFSVAKSHFFGLLMYIALGCGVLLIL